MPAFAPLERPTYDPFGPLGGYELGPAGQGEPVWSRLKGSVYPVLDLCMDAYYASLSKSFQGDIEFLHHVAAAVEFIHEGADVDVRDDASGGSCLHFAAGSGSLPLCKTLLSAKARLYARDINLQTPLWWAINDNHREVCRALLGLDPAQVLVTNIDQLTPLHEAAFLGRTQLVDLLLSRFSTQQHWNRYGRAVRLPSGPNMRAGRRLLSPLHLACRQGHLATCAVLLKAFADPQLVCSHGRTALHHACAGASRLRDLRTGNILELCHLLLRQQPALVSLRDASGQTPLDLVQRYSFAPPELHLLLRKAAPVGVHQETFTKPRDGHGGHRRKLQTPKA
ncbi:Ankyrin-1 (ANK-1) (Ankyrin-R) (Erythrocyte ankyrin) [Durusdinium trenchii]